MEGFSSSRPALLLPRLAVKPHFDAFFSLPPPRRLSWHRQPPPTGGRYEPYRLRWSKGPLDCWQGTSIGYRTLNLELNWKGAIRHRRRSAPGVKGAQDRILLKPGRRGIGALVVYADPYIHRPALPLGGGLCFQANGLLHTSPGQSPWVHRQVCYCRPTACLIRLAPLGCVTR